MNANQGPGDFKVVEGPKRKSKMVKKKEEVQEEELQDLSRKKGEGEKQGGLIKGMKSFFNRSKAEEKPRLDHSRHDAPSKKLPKNFANEVLDLELKIDTGNATIEMVDRLMQLYGVSSMRFFSTVI